MRRNCNLELRLLPSSAYYNNNSNKKTNNLPSSGSTEDSDHLYDSRHYRTFLNMEESNASSGLSSKTNQPLTIFYNGKICVSDVTEFQARAILMLASSELTEDRQIKTPTSDPYSPSINQTTSPLYSPTAALSMKKSLQRFLQKRKHRAQATSPYHR